MAQKLKFTQIDDPSAQKFDGNMTATTATGINNHGTIVGSYFDSSGQPHGYVYNHGTFITTQGGFIPADINDSNEMIGGDSIDSNGTITSVGPVPIFDTTGTTLNGLNNKGEIVGSYFGHNGFEGSFTYQNGVFTPFTAPGAINTVAGGVNDSGVIVGNARNAGDQYTHGFIDNHGTFTTLTVPGAQTDGLNGIDDAGDIVGSFNTASNEFPMAFIYTDNHYLTFNYPGAESTTFNNISLNGKDIVGDYTVQADDSTHAFVLPVADLTSGCGHLAAGSVTDVSAHVAALIKTS